MVMTAEGGKADVRKSNRWLRTEAASAVPLEMNKRAMKDRSWTRAPPEGAVDPDVVLDNVVRLRPRDPLFLTHCSASAATKIENDILGRLPALGPDLPRDKPLPSERPCRTSQRGGDSIIDLVLSQIFISALFVWYIDLYHCFMFHVLSLRVFCTFLVWWQV